MHVECLMWLIACSYNLSTHACNSLYLGSAHGLLVLPLTTCTIPSVPHLWRRHTITFRSLIISESYFNLAKLFHCRLRHSLGVCCSFMSLEINFTPKHRGKLFIFALSLFTEVVILFKMLPQQWVVTVVLLLPTALTEMTPKVVMCQVLVESIIVQVAIITKLAQWVSLVRCVIRVPLFAMPY